MTDLIAEIWAGLKDAGMPDVMLYLSDGSACRCHWNETALIGDGSRRPAGRPGSKDRADHAGP